MPESNVVIWVTAVGLIGILLAVVAYLINKVGDMITRAFDGLKVETSKAFDNLKSDIKDELKILWEKINTHQSLAASNAANMIEHKAIEAERYAGCLERHKVINEAISHLQKRRDSDKEE